MAPAADIASWIGKIEGIGRIDIAGSLRRRKETIGDIDLLVLSKHPMEVMERFFSYPLMDEVLAKGETKGSIRTKQGMQIDLRVIGKNFGAALLYFTGSQQHNIRLRQIAILKGYKLSEYGLFDSKTGRIVAGKSEKEIYGKLGFSYIEPELRENGGELEASKEESLPKLVDVRDIKGDLQMHSMWSDGGNTISELAISAQEIGHEYICITDHAGNLPITNALDPKRIKKYLKEIDEVNKKLDGITVLKGAEVNITKEGLLDVPNAILKDLDIVLGSVHSAFKMPKEEMTRRICRAMENENMDILAHPTGRILNKREPIQLDFEVILEKAKSSGTILEINATPERMDLDASHVRAAVRKDVKLSIGTDAHTAASLRTFQLGVFTARRGWAEKKDIINTFHLQKLLKALK